MVGYYGQIIPDIARWGSWPRSAALLYLLLPLSVSLTGCLQWRTPDDELARMLAARGLPAAIHHISSPSGGRVRYLEVRQQGVAKPGDALPGEPAPTPRRAFPPTPPAHDSAAGPLVESAGQAQGPLNVLMIHGAPSSMDVWLDYLLDPVLSSQMNLLAVDRPGYGYSDFGRPDTSILSQVAACQAILDRHEGDFVLFGQSYGGPIAAVLAARNPGRVRGVLLTSPALAPGEERIYSVSYWIRLKAFGWFFPTIFRVANAEKLSHYRQLLEAETYYPLVRAPITYIYGGRDELIYLTNIPYARERFTSTQIEFVHLPERGHFFTFDEIPLVERSLRRLAGLSPDGPSPPSRPRWIRPPSP